MVLPSEKVGGWTEKEDEQPPGEPALLDRKAEAELGDYQGEGRADVTNIRQLDNNK